MCVCEGIFDLCIYVAVTSLYPRDRSGTCLKSIRLKLKINRIENLKLLDLIMMVSTMTDMTDQVDIQNHFLISERVWQCC